MSLFLKCSIKDVENLDYEYFLQILIKMIKINKEINKEIEKQNKNLIKK